MIVHETVDVAQEAGSNDAHGPESNARIVDELVAFSESHLTRGNDHCPTGIIAGEPRNRFDLVQESGTRQCDGLGNVGLVGYSKLASHSSTDVASRIGYEFVDEDVVVDAVTDAATKDSDGKGESSHGGDKVLRRNVNSEISTSDQTDSHQGI